MVTEMALCKEGLGVVFSDNMLPSCGFTGKLDMA